MDNIITIKRREYGAAEEIKHVAESEVSDYQKKGWVLYKEPTPEPQKPDLEVMELRLKDAKNELERVRQEADKMVRSATGRVSNRSNELERAKNAILTEEVVLAEAQKLKDVETTKEKIISMLSPNRPIPERALRAAVHNQNQEQYLSDTFLNDARFVGRDEQGDRLFVLNKSTYLLEEAARKASEEKAKEDAIRARMEAK